MAESDVKLLGARASPYVNRVQIALNLKSIDYEFLEEKLGTKSELLLRCNPVHKKMPVLIHGEKPICESLIIVQYIDEAWTSGPSILPSDPYDCAIAHFWAAYIDNKWFPTLREIRLAEGEEEKLAAIERVMRGLVVLEDAFVQCSSGEDFFGGDSIGYLDIAFGCFLGWLRVGEEMGKVKLLNETKTPGLLGWAGRFSSHDAVKCCIPETEKLVDIAILHKAIVKAQSPN